MTYKIIFDDGKPYEVTIDNGSPRADDEGLKRALAEFYYKQIDTDYSFNVEVYNEDDEDISESDFVKQMVRKIIKEVKI